MNNTLFRKSSLDKVSSPDQLNDYIKVSNPGVWIVILALFILIAAVVVWGFAGSLPTTVHIKGVVLEGSVLCYVSVDSAASIRVGQAVKMQGAGREAALDGKVASVATLPVSAAEIKSELGSDYLAGTLAKEDFSVKVLITPDKAGLVNGTMLDLQIVTDSVRPADFLME